MPLDRQNKIDRINEYTYTNITMHMDNMDIYFLFLLVNINVEGGGIHRIFKKCYRDPH